MKNGLRTMCSLWGAKSAVVGAMLVVLTACGGGGGDGGGGFLPADPNAGLTSYDLSLALRDSEGNTVTTVTPGRTATLTVEVREANGVAAAVEGVIVTTDVGFAVVSPENGSAVTNADGVATFQITGGATRGADLAEVSVESPAGTMTSSIAFQIQDIALEFDVMLLDSDGLETSFIAPGRPGTLEVRVTQENPDGSMTPPSSALVVNALAGFATVLPENGAALTNPEGLASFELQSGDTSGADTVSLTVVSASGDEFTTTFPFQIFTDADGFAISLALVDGSGAITNQIDAGSPGTLRALLTRSNPLLGIDSEPVIGQILSAVSTDGEITPTNGASLTDDTGTASFGLAVGTTQGAQTATVSVNGPGGVVSATLPYEVVQDVQGAGFAALFLELQLRNATGQVITRFERGESGFIRARVLGRREGSQTRVLVPGIPVSVNAANGLITPTSGNLITDSSGEANFLIEAGDESGTDVITATVLGPSGPVSESLSYDVVGEVLRFTTLLIDASGRQTSFVAPGQPATLRVTVRVQNPDGSQSFPNAPLLVNAIANVAVLTPDNGAVVTNGSGVAEFQLAAGDTSGADLIALSADSEGGETFTDEFPLQVFTEDDEFSISLALFDSTGATTTQIDRTSPGELVALVRRSNPRRGIVNQPVEGQLAQLVVTDGIVTPANGARVTDAAGEARFGIAAGNVNGGQLATVTVNAPSGEVSAELPYEVVEQISGNGFVALFLELSFEDANGQTLTAVLPGQSAFLEATVRGRRAGSQAQVPAAGVSVNLVSQSSSISPVSGNIVSDGNGLARFRILAGTAPGQDQLDATVVGPLGPVVQSLTYDIIDADLVLLPTLLNGLNEETTFISPSEAGTLRVSVRERSPTGDFVPPSSPVTVNAVVGFAVLSPGNGSAVTNANGDAFFQLQAGTTSGADEVALTADTSNGETISARLAFEIFTEDDNFSLTLTLVDNVGAPITQIDAASPGTLVALLTRSNLALGVSNEPKNGQLIRASISNDGSITPSNGAALTNSVGEAIFGISAGTTIGAETITVSVDGPGGTLSEDLSYQVVEDVNGGTGSLVLNLRLLDSSSAQNNQLSQDEPLTLEVTVTDIDANPSAGIIVEAVTDVAQLAPANGRALTDANGVALFTLSAANESGAGTVTVTATSGGSSAERSINYQVFQLLFDLELTLVDVDDNPTTEVTTSRPATLRVQTISLNVPAQPVSGFVVTAGGSLVEISPSSGTSLTDEMGIAEFVLSAGDVEGADLLTVSLDTGTGVVSESIGVQVNVGGLNFGGFIDGTFTPGEIGFTVTDLAYGGSTRLNLAVVDDSDELVVNANQVRLTSDCSIRGEAGFRAVGDDGQGVSALVVNTDQGLAAAEYNAISCEGDDEIRATLIGENLSATGTVNIAPLSANYVGFVESDPTEGPESGDRTVIALAGSGGAPAGRPEVARVTFEVLASRPADGGARPGDPAYIDRDDRVPLPNAAVNFELSNDLAGIELCDPSGGCVTFDTLPLTTDQDGLVVVEIRAGNIPSQTFVVASYTDPESSSTVTSASNQIVISTGLPDQNSLSLSVADGFYVANAANVDGVERVITARLADRFNNPVPDGTTVIFRAEYGAIDSSCATGEANGSRLVQQGADTPSRGTCSVLWTSQAPRFPDNLPSSGEEIVRVFGDPLYSCPSHNGTAGPCPNDLGSVRGLRSSILAYVIGEEDFVDGNGNGLYDAGETFSNCEEAFIDFNENGLYTASFFEEFIDNDNDNMYGDGGLLNGAAVYNGTLCTADNEAAGVCSRQLINVRDGKVGCAVQAGLPQPFPVVLTLSSTPNNQRAILERTADDTVLNSGSTLDLGAAYAIHIADQFNNRPGNGTEITFELDDRGACAVLIEGNFIGGDNPASVTLTLNDGGSAPGATTISPIVVTNELDAGALGGTVVVSVEGVFLTSFSCL